MEAGKFPERITIELTNQCNLNCSFCPRHLVQMEKGDMSETLFRKIIDEAAEHLPVTVVLFFRGESLLNSRIANYIHYAKAKGIGPIQLASNALLLTEEMGVKLIEAGLDFISFSLDTNDEEVYKASRENGDLATSKRNILNFIEQCKTAKEKGLKVPDIQVSTVDIEEYRNGQTEFVNFWRKHADRVRVYIEHSGDGNLGSIADPELLAGSRRRPCRKVYSDMIVYWNGDVALCNHDWDNKMELGNVAKQSITDIWQGERYRSIRQMHEETVFEKEIACEKCDHWKMYYLEDGFLGKVYEKESV